MSFPRYSKYRENTEGWLGHVPAHWAVCALAYRYEVALGKMLDEKRISGRHLAPYLRNVDVQWGRINTADLPQMDFEGDDVVRYGLRRGDLLVCEGGEVGRAAIWDEQLEECYYQKALHRLRPRSDRDTTRFLFYLLRAAVAQGIFSSEGGKATIAHLPADAFRRICFPFPPADEQLAIADFLDRETAKINALIDEQEKLLTLLAEKRQATISHAVTRGLNPNVPWKHSGVPWLGEVPADWTVSALGFHLAEKPCYGVLVPDDDPDGVPMLRITDIENGTADRSALNTISCALAEQYSRTFVRQGDVVLSVVGTVGETLVVDSELEGVNLSRALARLVPAKTVRANWLRLFFQSSAFNEFLNLTCVGTAQRVLNMDDLRALRVTIPTLDVQEQVIASMNYVISKIDNLVAEASQATITLRERRSALISAAVTGKIDVRGLVAEREAA
jgi:type I restriction enzyme, S subunit